MEDKIAAINAAKDYLMEHGWIQRAFRNDGGSVCLVGAFTRSNAYNLTRNMQLLLDDIEVVVNSGLIHWNDQPGRTFNEVIDVLDETILYIKEKEADNG